MLTAAFERVLRAVPVASFDEFRAASGTTAMRCYASSCSACEAFDVSDRSAYETTLRATRTLPWDCDDEDRRRMALSVGVSALPAYIMIPPTPHSLSVRYPT